MGKRALIARLLIDGTTADPIENPVVVIQDDRIVEVSTSKVANLMDMDVIDLGEKAILPGLIDAHLHLIFFPGPDHEAGINALKDDVEHGLLPFRVIRNAQQTMLGGITTLRDSGDKGFVTLQLKDAIERELLIGPRLMVSGMAITTTDGHLCFCGIEADSVDEIRDAVTMLCEKGVDSIKVMATGGSMGDNDPLGIQYSQQQLEVLVEESHKRGKIVEAHATNTNGIEACVRADVDHIAHCVWWDAKGDLDYREDLVEKMIRQGTIVEMTVSGFFRRWLPQLSDSEEERQRKMTEMSHFYEPMRRMWKAGVKIIVHTDAGVRLTDFGAFAQGLQLMQLALDISPLEVIRTATLGAARALRLQDQVGSIEPGKLADLIVVDLNPLEDLSSLNQISMVLKGGKTTVIDGNLILT